MYLNRITLIGFIGSDAERKVADATNIAIFSLATKMSWKNDAGAWESRTEWHRCVAFGKLADFAGTLTKGAHVAIEGEIRSHEYQRELAVGTQKTTLAQRVWEIRVDSLLKFIRVAKTEALTRITRRCPAKGAFPFITSHACFNAPPGSRFDRPSISSLLTASPMMQSARARTRRLAIVVSATQYRRAS